MTLPQALQIPHKKAASFAEGAGGKALGPELASGPVLGVRELHHPLLQDPH